MSAAVAVFVDVMRLNFVPAGVLNSDWGAGRVVKEKGVAVFTQADHHTDGAARPIRAVKDNFPRLAANQIKRDWLISVVLAVEKEFPIVHIDVNNVAEVSVRVAFVDHRFVGCYSFRFDSQSLGFSLGSEAASLGIKPILLNLGSCLLRGCQ